MKGRLCSATNVAKVHTTRRGSSACRGMCQVFRFIFSASQLAQAIQAQKEGRAGLCLGVAQVHSKALGESAAQTMASFWALGRLPFEAACTPEPLPLSNSSGVGLLLRMPLGVNFCLGSTSPLIKPSTCF